MFVSPITLANVKNNYSSNQKITNEKKSDVVTSNAIKFADIPFYGVVKTKSVQNIFEQKQAKLLRQIDDILQTVSQETAAEDLVADSYQTIMAFTRNIANRKEMLCIQLEELFSNTLMTPQQKYERGQQIEKELNRIEKARPVFKEPPKPDPRYEKIDYELLNKFKSAILSENYNLNEVFAAHYSGLENITTVEELKELYPKIKIPKDPMDVIVDKIADTVTRDFYEQLDELYENGEMDELQKFAHAKMHELCELHAPIFKLDMKGLFSLIGMDLSRTVRDIYVKIKNHDKFSTIPERRKSDLAQISNDDKAMLMIDYDKYILYVLKELYLKSAKPSDINCSVGEYKINIGAIKDNCYKFDKIPHKIKGFIADAAELKRLQRDYDRFDTEALKSRLAFYANREAGNDENILEHIIEFDGCQFNQEDVKYLKQFLSELDNMSDGVQTLEQTISNISQKGLMPRGTERLNAEAKAIAAAKYKAEQKRLAQLSNEQNSFDGVMNILFNNNMNTLATSLSKYRPKDIESKSITQSEYLQNLINNSVNKSGVIENKTRLESQIVRWDMYNQFATKDMKDPLFKAAVDYAKDSNGEVNIDKAGQYLINANTVANYPACLEYHKDAEIIKKIMEKVGEDTSLAIETLNKYDEYLELGPLKSRLSAIMDIFSPKENIDKAVLKHIVEKDYAKIDTEIAISFNEHSEKTTQAAFCATAKQQVIDKYKFPGCLQYLVGFEDALSSVANTAGSSGIKQTGRNNQALAHKMELKLAGENDRLFSSNNDFRFDIFSEKGLH